MMMSPQARRRARRAAKMKAKHDKREKKFQLGVRLVDNKIQLYDGSGLSRYNLIKPSSLVLALEKIYQYLGPDRIKKIFPNNYIITGTEDFVWGKTGTLKNNHNYSGYIITDKGRGYIFSIMINHFTDDIDIIKEAISDFLKYIKSNA